MSYDSHRRISLKTQVLETINQLDHIVSPKEISQLSNVKHSSVRNYVRQLLHEGEIRQPYPHLYSSKLIHGMMREELKIHNLVLGFSASWLRLRDQKIKELRIKQRGRFVYEVREEVGDVRIQVQFGTQRRQITGRISCDRGMDKNAIDLALNRFYDICEERTGHVVDNVVVKTFEANRDVAGVRLDGMKCYTRNSLFGALERIYQKYDDTVRHELKVSQPMTIDQFTELVRGGVSEYNVSQALFLQSQQMQALVEAQKYSNRQILMFKDLVESIFERQDKIETLFKKILEKLGK